MAKARWKVASAAVKGASHVKSGMPCQDSALTDVINVAGQGPVLITVVSDGAGSAKLSNVGSQLACSHFVDQISTYLCGGNQMATLSRATMQSWLQGFQYRLESLAARFDVRLQDFACTLLIAILGERYSAFAQIGDGAIIVAPHDEPDELCWVYWPQQGEYVNTTYFATSPDAPTQLQFDLVPHPIDELAMVTDGLQRFALHSQSRTVQTPFLLPKLKYLRKYPSGYLPDLSAVMAKYLDSEPVNERTDDDKTLILATRRSHQERLPQE